MRVDEIRDPTLRARIRAKIAVEGRVAVCSEEPEQGGAAALDEAAAIPAIHGPCCFVVHVWRTGANWDIDNSETKSIADSLVACGIFEDDNISVLSAIYKEGHRCKTKAEEKTVIEVWG